MPTVIPGRLKSYRAACYGWLGFIELLHFVHFEHLLETKPKRCHLLEKAYVQQMQQPT